MIKQCGIYAIENKINHKRYYGSTANWTSRKNEHINGRKNKNPHLQAAWNKYGEDAFTFIWIQDVHPDFLLRVEQLHLEQEASVVAKQLKKKLNEEN